MQVQKKSDNLHGKTSEQNRQIIHMHEECFLHYVPFNYASELLSTVVGLNDTAFMTGHYNCMFTFVIGRGNVFHVLFSLR